ncbi:hypothetical protein HYALB_00013129 [Hymenoscyphus albidus]|uniref:Uncharacterized protein n=1 Tax=Hymenoscyphus albidus TaxID=595503 RepID=A0A9N9LTY3_9HELO|nr:hypothetical protein HYALB_00013129 [Hymenoscyphus albidus]
MSVTVQEFSQFHLAMRLHANGARFSSYSTPLGNKQKKSTACESGHKEDPKTSNLAMHRGQFREGSLDEERPVSKSFITFRHSDDAFAPATETSFPIESSDNWNTPSKVRGKSSVVTATRHMEKNL